MRKSFIALTLTSCLLAAWAGTSWYSGKLIEQQYSSQVEGFNQQLENLKQTGMVAQIKNTQLERGIFSSQLTYQISLSTQDKTHIIPFKGTIYHGPITLNNFSFSLFSLEAEIEKNQNTEIWFEADKPLFKATLQMDYQQNMQGDFISQMRQSLSSTKTGFMPINWEVQGNFSQDKQGNARLQTQFPTLNFAFLSTEKNQEIQLQNVQAQFSWQANSTANQHSENAKSAVDFHSKIEKLLLKQKDTQQNNAQQIDAVQQINQIDLATQITTTADFIDIELQSQIAQFADNNHFAGKIRLAHLERQALNKILATMLKPHSAQTNEKAVNEKDEKLTKEWRTLLNNRPHIQIPQFTFSGKQGQFNANLDIAPIQNVESIALKLQTLFGLFDSLKIDLNFDKTVLKDMFNLPSIYNPSLSSAVMAQTAQQKSEAFLADLRKYHIFRETEDKMSLEMKLDKDILHFNQQQFNEQQIKMGLISTIMMYGGLY